MIPAPDPIPDPVPMSEAEAATVLLTIAALHGGTVHSLVDLSAGGEFVGFALMPPGMAPIEWIRATRKACAWTWAAREACLEWQPPQNLGRLIIPTGRIDRGLGAYRQKRKAAPDAKP